MMNDDKMDELIRTAAQEYNRPPATVPRDEMWAVIETARAERARRPLHVVAPAPRRTFSRITWLGAAAAAVLLIVTGVGIGRWSASRIPVTPPRTAVAVATTPRETTVETPKSPVALPGNEPSNRITEIGTGNPAPVTGSKVAGRGQRVSGIAPRESGTGYRVPGSSSPVSGTGSTEVPYQLATVRHLANAEALLTAFNSDSRDAKMDAQLSAWARDLLSTTRLLLDSPAADDPQRARLLGDLELVLAQIVQLSPGASAQDRGLVEGSIQNGHVMTRLRSAIPAGQTRGL